MTCPVTTSQAQRIWKNLLRRCASTPERDHDKVKRLVMVSFDDVQFACEVTTVVMVKFK